MIKAKRTSNGVESSPASQIGTVAINLETLGELVARVEEAGTRRPVDVERDTGARGGEDTARYSKEAATHTDFV